MIPSEHTWPEWLEIWRRILCDELLAIPRPIRTNADRAKDIDLKFSIVHVDRGTIPYDNWCRERSRLGELMRRDGFVETLPPDALPADPGYLFQATLPWFGDLKTLAKRERQRERQELQQQQAERRTQERAERRQKLDAL